MRNKFFLFFSAIYLLSCNNEPKTDSTMHNDHRMDHIDSASVQAPDMMSLMNTMMDSMRSIRSTGDPDADFAALMRAHHLGAIRMAQAEVQNGNDSLVKAMAQQMIIDQQKEVKSFDDYLSSHPLKQSNGKFYDEAIQNMEMMRMDSMTHSSTIDKQFVQMMIPHHRGAVNMSKAYLKNGARDTKLKSIASNIVASQLKEIAQLEAWLRKN